MDHVQVFGMKVLGGQAKLGLVRYRLIHFECEKVNEHSSVNHIFRFVIKDVDYIDFGVFASPLQSSRGDEEEQRLVSVFADNKLGHYAFSLIVSLIIDGRRKGLIIVS